MASPASVPTPASSLPLRGASPRVIRDALTIPEDRAEFDREYERALATAAETMELAGVHALVEQWRRRAWVTHDLEAYQRMADRVDRLRRCEDVPSETRWPPWRTQVGGRRSVDVPCLALVHLARSVMKGVTAVAM
jgi:hypothetical protein